MAFLATPIVAHKQSIRPTSNRRQSKTNGRSLVYLERSNNTFSTADESYGTNSFEEVQSIERSASSLLRSAILFKKREKAGLPRTSGNEVETKDNTTSLQKMRRLRKERLKAESQASAQSLEPQPRAKIESRRAAKVRARMSKRNEKRNPTTEQPANSGSSSNIKQVSIKTQSTSNAGLMMFVGRAAQMCHSPASTAGTLPSSHGLEMATPCSNMPV